MGAGAGSALHQGDKLFRHDHVLKIQLRMDRGSFAKLCQQTRTPGHGYAKKIFGPPPASPFTWFRALLTVDEKKIGVVGVRKKGFYGSLSSTRPSLKINTGKFKKGLVLDGIKRLVLNNGKEGPSFLRQCMAYEIFSTVSYPAPRCAFAHVWVNGRDLGLYVLLEHVDKSMLARYFKNPGGALFEGTGSDFRPKWQDTFEPKNKSAKKYLHRLQELTELLQKPDGELLDSLHEFIDLDSFYTFWALESIVGHQDGYNASGNNFFLYLDPDSGLLYFIPWGMDKVMAYADRVVSDSPLTVLTGSVISCRLYAIAKTRNAYIQRLRQLLDEIGTAGEFLARLRAMHKLVIRHMLNSQRDRFKYMYPGLLDFVKNRVRVLRRALKNNEPEPVPRLLAPPLWRIPNSSHMHGPR